MPSIESSVPYTRLRRDAAHVVTVVDTSLKRVMETRVSEQSKTESELLTLVDESDAFSASESK